MKPGKVRRVLGRLTGRSGTPADSRTEVIEIAPGADFGDLTSVELCDRAVAEGRIESFLLVGERFGGEPTGPNVVLGPVGSAAAKGRIDDEIAAAFAESASAWCLIVKSPRSRGRASHGFPREVAVSWLGF